MLLFLVPALMVVYLSYNLIIFIDIFLFDRDKVVLVEVKDVIFHF